MLMQKNNVNAKVGFNKRAKSQEHNSYQHCIK